MHHFRWHEVESARSDLSAFAVASQGGRALDHGVRFIAVCQCLRTWIAFDVRISKLVACVFGSTRRIQISGESAPRSGKILSHLRSEKLLKIGAAAAASGAIASGSAARALRVKPHAAIRTARYTFVFMELTVS